MLAIKSIITFMIHIEVHDAPLRQETDFVLPRQPADCGCQFQRVQLCDRYKFFLRAFVIVQRTPDDAGILTNLFLVHALKD